MADENEVIIPSKEALLGEDVTITSTEAVDEGPGETAPSVSPIELRAMEHGWTPKDKWSGDPSAWRPADVWLDRGEMLRQISHLKGKVELTEKQVSEAFKQGQQMADARLKDEISELKAARRNALQEQDFVTADKLDDKIDELKDKRQVEASKPQPAKFTPPKEYDVFVQRNPWYLENTRLQYYADSIGRDYAKQNPNASWGDLYFFVEQEMIKEQKIGAKTPIKSPPAPEGGRSTPSSNGGGAKGGSFASIKAGMSEQERQIMNTLVKTKTFESEEAYLKEYSKS